MVPFSGVNVTSDFTVSLKADLIAELKDAAVAADWVAVANGSGWDLTSQTTPDGLWVRWELQPDPNGALENTHSTFHSATLNSSTTFDLTASNPFQPNTPYRIVIDPYQFFVYKRGVATPDFHAAELMAGVPALPDPLSGIITEAWWAIESGGAGGPYNTFRASVTPNGAFNNYAFNGSLGVASTGNVRAFPPRPAHNTTPDPLLWYSGAILDSEVLIGWGTSTPAVPRVMGLMWDAVFIWENFPFEDEQTFGGRNWVNISSATMVPSIWVVKD